MLYMQMDGSGKYTLHVAERLVSMKQFITYIFTMLIWLEDALSELSLNHE